jgi:quercetin dioxygenase-like cupin family protein
MITVEYAPGESDPVHRHNAHALVYVLEGTIVMQVEGRRQVTLKAGQTFYEGPTTSTSSGTTRARTDKAKFLVFLVKDKGAPILIPTTVGGR